MRLLRGALAAVGAVLVAGVLAVALDPSLAEPLPVDDVVSVLGNDYLFVAVFGVAALALLVATLGVRAVSGLNQATPPRPESVQSAPRFGEDFDETLATDGGPLGAVQGDGREGIRQQLRSEAIRVEAAGSDARRSAARDRVESGAWTDDDVAATFLGSDSPSLAARARAALHGETWFQRGARRTAEAVVAADGGRR